MAEARSANERGHLTWGGCDTVDLAAEYGTPLYVMDESILAGRMAAYANAVSASYPGLRLTYAGKAFLCGAMVKAVREQGWWLDVVSGGELHLALASGFDPGRIIFHGNNKSQEEIEYGLVSGVGIFVVDNLEEMHRLDAAAGRAGRRQDVLLRVTPGISPRTHRAVQTGQVDSKFGFLVAGGAALSAIKQCLELEHLDLRGIHLHIGSQIRETSPFRAAARAAARLVWEAWRETGYLAEQVNLGGGWAAGLPAGQSCPPISEYVAAVAGSFRRAWRRYGTPGVVPGRAATTGGGRLFHWPVLYLEPGRSIVADAGITLYTVGAVKPVPGHQAYVLVDGGMTDNPRPALYGSLYQALLANRPGAQPAGRYALAGKACESGDVLIRGASLPAPLPGDIVAVFGTGAYNQSMSSNYNRLGRPAVVFAGSGTSRLAVRRESHGDMVRTDLELATSGQEA